MATQLKIIQSDKAKGTSATKTQEAAEELVYLMTFSQRISQTMARTMQDLSVCLSTWRISLWSDGIATRII